MLRFFDHDPFIIAAIEENDNRACGFHMNRIFVATVNTATIVVKWIMDPEVAKLYELLTFLVSIFFSVRLLSL